VRIFLSAGRDARPYCSPNLIAGIEADVQSNVEVIRVAADTDEEIALVGKPTGKFYHNLPWWEVVIK
jgi:hypothetical protein